MPGPIGTDFCIYCRQRKDQHFPMCPVLNKACSQCNNGTVEYWRECPRCKGAGGQWYQAAIGEPPDWIECDKCNPPPEDFEI